MKLSFLIGNLGIRGSVRRVVELSNGMVKRGHDVTIYHSDGQPCEWLTCYAMTSPEYQAQFDEHDALIFFGDALHWQIVKSAKSKIKALYILGLNEKDPDLANNLTGDGRRDARTSAVREAIHSPGIRVMANCTALVEFLASIGISAFPVLGGVNGETFYPHNVERDAMILAGGAKREIEGTGLVLETMKIVNETYPNVRLETYAKRGHSQDRLAELYSTASVFLDAQHHGGWNNAVAEAMACECPVVCTDIWGNRDFAVNKKTAMIANEPVKMAWAICRLLNEFDLQDMLVQNAKEKIKPYTWDKATDQLEEALFSCPG